MTVPAHFPGTLPATGYDWWILEGGPARTCIQLNRGFGLDLPQACPGE